MRGKNRPGNAKPGTVIYKIMEHIASFPIKDSHYSGKGHHYLSEKLNVLTMFKLIKRKNPTNIDENYRFYLKIFKERFDLSFGRPQVDTCCTCEELDVKIKSKFLNETAKRAAEAEKAIHSLKNSIQK